MDQRSGEREKKHNSFFDCDAVILMRMEKKENDFRETGEFKLNVTLLEN